MSLQVLLLLHMLKLVRDRLIRMYPGSFALLCSLISIAQTLPSLSIVNNKVKWDLARYAD